MAAPFATGEHAGDFLARIRKSHQPIDSLADMRRIERMAYDGDLIHVDEVGDYLRHLVDIGVDLPPGVYLADPPPAPQPIGTLPVYGEVAS